VRQSSRRFVPVRLRITAAVVLLVAVALAGAGFVVYTLESQRLERAANDQVRQEILEFEAFQGDTDDRFASPRALIRAVLLRNTPAGNELLMALTDGQQTLYQAGVRVHRDFQDEDNFDEIDPEFLAALAGADPRGESLRVDTERYGPAIVSVKPVLSTNAAPDSAFVIAYFMRGERAELVETMRTYAIVAAVSLLLITASAYAIAGRLLKPVRQLQEAARTISHTDLTRRIEARGNDDLTELTHTVNDMLDRLQEAFSGQRQFLDDAGHELRTPITIVRGHLELLDPGDTADVKQTVDLVTDEVDRMSRLVDDLILLAKSRRPDFLRRECVSIRELTDDVAEKLRGLGDRTWSVDERADATVALDPQRITQALAQLASNAVRYTSPGDTIAVGSRLVGTDLLLWVRDTGTGIAYEHLHQVFERFYQVDAEKRGGGGLGLSIVKAIAQAHGGTVGVRSVLGDGATFTLVLPTSVPEWNT
jgi:signal transduction histidine kinase